MRQVLAEAVADRLRREGDGEVRELVAVRGEAYVLGELGNPRPAKAGERGAGERARDLPRPVGAEVHEHDDVAVAHGRGLAGGIDDGGGLDEFVVFAARVGGLERLRDRGWRRRARVPSTRSVVRLGHALPVLVAVHRVVAADDRRDARARIACANLVHERERSRRAARRRIAAVQKGVHENLRDAGRGGEVDHGRDLPLVAVHAARRQEPHHVQRAMAVARGVDRAIENGIGRELAGFDRVIDPREVLVDDAAGADVEVPDLGVAHLPVRQSHAQLGGVDRRVGYRREQAIPVRHRALPIALSGAGGRSPKPSRIRRTTGRTAGRRTGARAAAGARERRTCGKGGGR